MIMSVEHDDLSMYCVNFIFSDFHAIHSVIIQFLFLPVQVIPQLIARIDTPRALVGRLIHQLLTDIGRYHPQVSVCAMLLNLFHNFRPSQARICYDTLLFLNWTVSLQALIYPLTVASKSTTTARHNAANKILKNMCEHCNTLVQQAIMVHKLTLKKSLSLSKWRRSSRVKWELLSRLLRST